MTEIADIFKVFLARKLTDPSRKKHCSTIYKFYSNLFYKTSWVNDVKLDMEDNILSYMSVLNFFEHFKSLAL
jgi:hypothetical protein